MTKQSKIIEDEEYLQYKKQLANFMQSVNPKPTLEDVDLLRKKYLDKREVVKNG